MMIHIMWLNIIHLFLYFVGGLTGVNFAYLNEKKEGIYACTVGDCQKTFCSPSGKYRHIKR